MPARSLFPPGLNLGGLSSSKQKREAREEHRKVGVSAK